jgi:SagB-type dehydrogenase family enzyme
VTTISRHYADLVRDRQVGIPDELLPASHKLKWEDAPSPYTVFTGTTRVPLCHHLQSDILNEAIGCKAGKHHRPAPVLTLALISDILLLSAGILGRRVGINWSGAAPLSSRHERATYSRGPASGGGLYPTDIYLISNNIAGMPSGLYHYDTAHHALGRLRMGDYWELSKQACQHASVDGADCLLVLTARFWKTLFKYYNFAFQVVTHDAGCLSDCIQQIASRFGLDPTILYWFADHLLGNLLGLETDDEIICAVIALHGSGQRLHPNLKRSPEPATSLAVSQKPNPHRYEHSKNIFLPDLLRNVHRDAIGDGERKASLDPFPQWRPAGVERAACQQLPEGCNTGVGFSQALLSRASSYGRFRYNPPLTLEELAQLFCFIDCGGRHNTDVYARSTAPMAVRLSLIARNVSGLKCGVYAFDPVLRRLVLTRAGEVDQLQRLYFLENYNLEQIAAIIVIVGRLQEVLSAWGSRGVRIMNAESGMLAQRCYLAASALGLGCGAALGVNAILMNPIVGANGESESAILQLFIGHQVASADAYDFAY